MNLKLITIIAMGIVSAYMLYDMNKAKIQSLFAGDPLRSPNATDPVPMGAWPDNIGELQLPISILVIMGQTLDCGLEGGQQVQLQWLNAETFVYNGYINGELAQYPIEYSEIKEKTTNPNSNEQN